MVGWLSNNVRVLHRAMDDRQHEVSVRIALIGGEMLECADDRGIRGATRGSRPATRRLPRPTFAKSDRQRSRSAAAPSVVAAAADGAVAAVGAVAAMRFRCRSRGAPTNSEPGFQLAYLLLTEPKIKPHPSRSS